MIKELHSPHEANYYRYEIHGDNIQEIIDYVISRIRVNSKVFYKRELESDLKEKGVSMVDGHAGQGVTYKIFLSSH